MPLGVFTVDTDVHFLIDSRRQGLCELAGILGKCVGVDAPEETEEHTFHAFRSEQSGKGQEGEKQGEEHAAPWFPTEHEVAEEELAVPRDQRAVEVKQGDTLRRSGGKRVRHSGGIRPESWQEERTGKAENSGSYLRIPTLGRKPTADEQD